MTRSIFVLAMLMWPLACASSEAPEPPSWEAAERSETTSLPQASESSAEVSQEFSEPSGTSFFSETTEVRELPLGCENPEGSSWERYCKHHADPRPTCADTADMSLEDGGSCQEEVVQWLKDTDHPNRDSGLFPFPWESGFFGGGGSGLTIIL